MARVQGVLASLRFRWWTWRAERELAVARADAEIRLLASLRG